jgi:hypothetical protein
MAPAQHPSSHTHRMSLGHREEGWAASVLGSRDVSGKRHAFLEANRSKNKHTGDFAGLWGWELWSSEAGQMQVVLIGLWVWVWRTAPLPTISANQ